MSKLHIYCVTNKRLPFLEESSYKLCSVGKEFLHDKYLNSNSLKNIFEKEKYYSELTFHYWYWKNLMDINNHSLKSHIATIDLYQHIIKNQIIYS